MKQRPEKLLSFLDESIDYFLKKAENIDKDRYFSDRYEQFLIKQSMKSRLPEIQEFLKKVKDIFKFW